MSAVSKRIAGFDIRCERWGNARERTPLLWSLLQFPSFVFLFFITPHERETRPLCPRCPYGRAASDSAIASDRRRRSGGGGDNRNTKFAPRNMQLLRSFIYSAHREFNSRFESQPLVCTRTCVYMYICTRRIRAPRDVYVRRDAAQPLLSNDEIVRTRAFNANIRISRLSLSEERKGGGTPLLISRSYRLNIQHSRNGSRYSVSLFITAITVAVIVISPS